MAVDRRSLMKGMLAGGALLALGVPPWTLAGPRGGKPQKLFLWLGGSSVDGMFVNGAKAACGDMAYSGLRIVRQGGGVLTDTKHLAGLLQQFRETRWIAVMDDASAVVFLELVRTASAHLHSMGLHVCTAEPDSKLRHEWTTTSPAYGMGGSLASQLIKIKENFQIRENFLQESTEMRPLKAWTAPGFSTFRSVEPKVTHLHCSGLSFPEGSQLLDWDGPKEWKPIPPQLCVSDPVAWWSENWVESVGYVITRAALGVESIHESCSTRMFVHQTQEKTRNQPTERFVSFVIDL